MATLLVVHHSPTDTVRALTDAVLAGAGHEDIEGVEVVERAARIVAAEARDRGKNWLLGPSVALSTSHTDEDLSASWGASGRR